MSYPQPSADQYAVSGYQFFRLNTFLASGGDIYESAQSGIEVSLGPDSDIANVMIAYFDQQQANLMNLVGISPSRSVVGRIDANNVSAYIPSGRPGKVLLWPNDLWNPTLTQSDLRGEGGNPTNFILETPYLDVIEYFQPQPSLVPQRNDKTWLYQDLVIPPSSGTSGQIVVTIPYYGRKYAHIFVDSLTNNGATVDIRVIGQILEINEIKRCQNVALNTTNNVSSYEYVVQAGKVDLTLTTPNGGMFDLLTVVITAHNNSVQPDGAFLRIITSDTPAPE